MRQKPKKSPSMTGSFASRGHFITHDCAICGKTHEVQLTYRSIVGMQRIGGPGWDPLFACNDHSEFEVEVWKVKTNRRSYEGDRTAWRTDTPKGQQVP